MAGRPRLRSRIHGGPRCVKELVRIRGKVDAAAAYRENAPKQLAFLHRLADALDAFIREGMQTFPTWDQDPRDRRRVRKRAHAETAAATAVRGTGTAAAGLSFDA